LTTPGSSATIPVAMATGAKPMASGVKLLDATSGRALPHAPALLSSVPFEWRGVIVEWHRLLPQELPEHYVDGHGLSISTGAQPIQFGWKDGGRRRDGLLNPGEFHLLTHGDVNTPRWMQTFDEVTVVLDRQFVSDVVRDGLPPDRIAFVTQRSARDVTVAGYASAFRSELADQCPRGSLYAETLTIGFTLHLLSRYAVARPRVPRPRGKLSAWQLRAVVDFIHAHLDDEVPLVALADIARVSPFHFAREFRATVGSSPHQFVLRQRIQRSLHLMKCGRLPLAQIAVTVGFHDQAHFTRAFRRVIGTTPAQYSGRR
jgi:AraC family transcriptional regulator